MSAAAPSEALAASILFPQERARLSSIGREGKRALPDAAAVPETASGAAKRHRNHENEMDERRAIKTLLRP